MTVETGDRTYPPSETRKKRAKDRGCNHFTTSCPHSSPLATQKGHQANYWRRAGRANSRARS